MDGSTVPLMTSSEHPPDLIFDNTMTTDNNVKVYKRRWLVLFVLATLNFTSGILWITFSNIVDTTSIFYHTPPSTLNWLSIVFMLSTILLGLPGIWILHRYGLRTILFLSGFLNLIGSILRLLSSLQPFHQHSPFTLLLIGQTIAGCAQPLIFFSTTRLAALWFAKHQRTMANMVASVANPIGVAVGSVLSSFIITPSTSIPHIQQHLTITLGIQVGLCGVAFLLTFFVTSSTPPTPPSFSAFEETDEFWPGLKKLFSNKQYLTLALTYGSAVGVLSSLLTIVDQLLLPFDYSDKFSAVCTCLFFGWGLVGSMVLCALADRLLRHEVISKVAFSLASAAIVLFVLLTQHSKMEVYLSIIISLAGFFSIALIPLCLELSVESSFPVSEAASGGVLVLAGQIMASVYTFLLSISSTTSSIFPPPPHQAIIPKYSILTFILVVFLSDVIFVIFYRCHYIRKQFEEGKEAERVMRHLRESYTTAPTSA